MPSARGKGVCSVSENEADVGPNASESQNSRTTWLGNLGAFIASWARDLFRHRVINVVSRRSPRFTKLPQAG